jgi:hypothetical protein
MTITNQTLMWLAPVAGAMAMAATTLLTNWFDVRRARKQAATSNSATVPFELARDAAIAAVDAVLEQRTLSGRLTGPAEPKVRVPETTHRP